MTGFRFLADMMSRSLPLLSLIALALTGCAASPEAPPNNPAAAAPLPQEASVISIPVSVDLEQLGTEMLRQLPRPVYAGTQRRTLPVRFNAMRTSYALEPGTCSVTALNCLTRNAVRTVAADYTALTEADIDQEMTVRGLQMRMEGSQFSLTAQVEFSLQTRFRASTPPQGEASCGTGRERPRFELMLGGNVGWGGQGEAVISPRPYYVRWLQPCTLTAFPVTAEALLNLPALRDRLLGAVEGLVLSRLGQNGLRAQLERAWPELNAPREIRPGVWLLPHPEKVAFADLVGRGRYVSASVLVQAHPELVKGERPAVVVPPLPSPERGIGSTESMHLAIRGDLPLAQAQLALRERLSRLRMANGEPVRLGRVRLYGHGDRAVLGLTFTEPALAEIHLLARPVYDLEHNEVHLEELALTPASSDYLRRAAPALAEEGWLLAVQEEARFGFDEDLVGAVRDFRDLSVAAGEELTWRGGIRRLQPQALYFTRDSLVAYVQAEGKLALEARQK